MPASYSFDSTRYPTAESRGRSVPQTILQSQFDLSLPAGRVPPDPTWRMAGNANSPDTPSPSRTHRRATSIATSLPSLCASNARRRPLMVQARVNMICRPSASTSGKPSTVLPVSILSLSNLHALSRVCLLFASWIFETEPSSQRLKMSRLFPRVKCLTVSLARTFVVPSQTLLLAVSLHKRLILNSGSSGSSAGISI